MQAFDFGFEEEESIEGMKKLIVGQVNHFRSLVRSQARAAGQARRQDRCALNFCTILHYPSLTTDVSSVCQFRRVMISFHRL